MADLQLYNSLTRKLEPFTPVHPGEARVYTCGPTVYNYPHIGNMRAYVFADTLGRVLSYKGYKLTHVINITDVGHLTDDADAGEDKLEKAAKANAQSIWDIARHYTEAYWADVRALNIRGPMKDGKPSESHWSIATKFIPEMITFAESIADKHCYQLDSGLYFDVSTVRSYGRLAGHNDFIPLLLEYSKDLREGGGFFAQQQGAISKFLIGLRKLNAEMPQAKFKKMIELLAPLESANEATFEVRFPEAASEFGNLLNMGRIDPVPGKRNDLDFAIWRTTPAGETRQMEWDSPWGKGAPGWHLECSVMSEALLGLPFDIHTGGIDHREIHHPNEIAQNQARCSTDASGANIWMHNNFLIDRTGKMSKSSGEFLRLQLLIDKGFHPLAYRLMCLQAHYRSELEFSWEGLQAAFTRLKRMITTWTVVRASPVPSEFQPTSLTAILSDHVSDFDRSVSDDLNTSRALTIFDEVLFSKGLAAHEKGVALLKMDEILGLGLAMLTRADLRIRPKSATITEAEIETTLAARREARAAKDFARSDALRDQLIAAGVEVMDGDPLGWDWRIEV